MKAKKKAWIVIIVLAVIGFCVGFYFAAPPDARLRPAR